MQPKVHPLVDVLKEVERQAGDAAWDGKETKYATLIAVAHRLRERIAAGEEWEPLF